MCAVAFTQVTAFVMRGPVMSDSRLPENGENAPQQPSRAGSDAPLAALPERPRTSRSKAVGGVLIAALALALAGGGWALTRGDEASQDSGATGGSAPTTVRIGTTEAAADYWPPLQTLAKQNGINLEVVNFSDYTQANPALAQKQIDLNLFQHLQFLAGYNVNDSQTLAPIGSSVVVPLGLYSTKHTNVAQIPDGGTIAIPNDATNQARALLVLQQAKLLTLKGGGSSLSTPADIDAAASKVKVTPVDAAQTVAALPSVDGSIVNNNFALDAKLDPKSALFSDDPAKPEAEPYINVFVARAQDKDNPTYAKLVRLYHDPSVVSAVKAQSKNTAVIVDRPAADLQRILAGLQKAQGK